MERRNKTYKLEEQIVKNFTEGNIKAFDYIYLMFSSRIFYFVIGLVKIEEVGEEIVQDIFVKVWEAREKVQKFGSFESFLFTISHNTTISHLRKKATFEKYVEYIKSIQTEVEDPLLEEKIDFERFKQNLERVIESMPKKQKEVFMLKYYEDYSYKQISEKLNISIKTVENHLLNSRRFLKERLSAGDIPILLFIFLFV